MTGPQKAAAIIALAVIALGWFNWRMWRGLKAAQAMRASWTDVNFDAMLVRDGVSPLVTAKVRGLVRCFYGKGVAPHPDDDFAHFLGVDESEVADIAATGVEEFGYPRPAPEAVPPLRDLRELACYLQKVIEAK